MDRLSVCDDGNVCTDDSCDTASGCLHTNNTAQCSDDNGCTQNDTCQTGTCIPGPPAVCTPQDACHVAGTCDPATGLCSNPPKTGGPTDVIPTLVCVKDKGGGQYEALFGYANPNESTSNIPVGADNKFFPGPVGRGQLEYFLPTTSSGAFSVHFDGSPLTWMLSGVCATASSQSATCPSNLCSPACRRGERCVGGRCATQCGDDLCGGDENCTTCPEDCACPTGMVCFGNTCATPVECGGASWQCGSGISFGVNVDCGECPNGGTCKRHICQ